jgi:hypothetical protein
MNTMQFNADLSISTAEKQFSEIISGMRKEANRLRVLVESRRISVPEYKRMMWEHLGISPHCIAEGVTYVLNPE